MRFSSITLFKSKFVMSIIVVILLLSSFSNQQVFAATKYSCGSKCVGVLIDSTEHSATTNNLPVGTGFVIYFQLQNNGTHGMAFGIYDYYTDELVSTAKYAAPGGNNYDFLTVTGGVSRYYLRVVCGGNGQTGCSGDAYMEIQ